MLTGKLRCLFSRNLVKKLVVVSIDCQLSVIIFIMKYLLVQSLVLGILGNFHASSQIHLYNSRVKRILDFTNLYLDLKSNLYPALLSIKFPTAGQAD
jgi:hypothetical protein